MPVSQVLARFAQAETPGSDFEKFEGMIANRRLLSRLPTFVLAWLISGLEGCSQELGPERMPVTQVQGAVREGNRPVSGGWIEFFPVDGTIGNLRSARVRPDGSFEADKVPIGLNLIRLVNVPLTSPAAQRLFGAYSSPIRRTIPGGPTHPIVIDVVDETIRWQKSLARRPGPEPRGPGESR